MSDYESYEYHETRRDFKKERKLFTKNDRSKYKKTDKDKVSLPPLSGTRGRVISVEPSLYYVLTEADELFSCYLKGSLKQEKTLSSNLIAIGDFVRFTPFEDKTGMISAIEPRKSVLARAKERNKHLIAANVDQVLIVCSIVSPPLKIPLIDRYIIATKQGNMEPIIVINKIDLQQKEHDEIAPIKDLYEKMHIPVVAVSSVTKEGMDQLKALMQDKLSVFSGQSGVGKTSLINEITSSSLRVGEVVAKTNKGAHTTTKATLIPLKPSGFCIDTPGIKSFGLWELSYESIYNYFTDFKEYHCKFPDCKHTHEPDCGVKNALEKGAISLLRYQSYITLIEEVENERHQTR